MSEAIVVVLVVAVAALGVVLALVVRRGSGPVDGPSGLLAEKLRRRVIVTLKSGEAFEGLLFEADPECVVLREAIAIAYTPDSDHVPVQGELLVLRTDVAYLQIP